MILSFNIEYRTTWGEEVCVMGSVPELGCMNPLQALPLHTIDGINWQADIKLDTTLNLPVHYQYIIRKGTQTTRCEWNGVKRTLQVHKDQTCYYLHDAWKDIPENQSFYSSAFTEALLAHKDRTVYQPQKGKRIVLKAYAPEFGEGYTLAVCGNQASLGNWNPEKAAVMSDANFPEWTLELNASELQFPFEYKFICIPGNNRAAAVWEDNPNRLFPTPKLKEGETVVLSDRYVRFNLPSWKGAGVAVPVFSLRSENSCGTGDFGDLKTLIDWAVKTHQKIVQILPINDTTMTHTWTDSYPYNSISIYALHPMYLDLRQLDKLHNHMEAKKFEERRKAVNALGSINYEAASQLKLEYARQLFNQNRKRILASRKFQQFFTQNKHWLMPYAAFCYLRDKYRTPNFREWPEYSTYQAGEIETLCSASSKAYPEIAFTYYLQYNLHLQLLQVSTYARAHQVVLKGDIPIGISRNSVEAWTEPHYFNLNGQAGAPPDDFSVNGQNWEFPTYNWEVMASDGYRWWMKRFQKMSEYFDAYRIDHILGFFRIWEIPLHSVHGLLGQFVPALPMDVSEIQTYGLKFREDMLRPYIQEDMLNTLFGPASESVKETFLTPDEELGRYRLRDGFTTQQQVKEYFSQQADTEENQQLREGLYTLISNVLFVPDRQQEGLYHPRIAVLNETAFTRLTPDEQEAFRRLYNHYFYERHNQFWQEQALKKLPQLTESTRMLVCGEDLGMIPACVPWVMQALRILSLEIQRMPKQPGQEFARLNEYPYRSVCSFSTHDMSTLREWWEENSQQTQRYYNQVLGHYGEAPRTATADICREVVRAQLQSSSMFCILSLQDWLSIDGALRNPDIHAERINIPANPRHYWRYRMHLTLEQLLRSDSFNQQLRNLIQETGRNPQ